MYAILIIILANYAITGGPEVVAVFGHYNRTLLSLPLSHLLMYLYRAFHTTKMCSKLLMSN